MCFSMYKPVRTGTAATVMTMPNIPLPKTPLSPTKSCLRKSYSMRDDLLSSRNADTDEPSSLGDAPACIR